MEKSKGEKGLSDYYFKECGQGSVIKKKVRQTYENISGKVPGKGNVSQKYLS